LAAHQAAWSQLNKSAAAAAAAQQQQRFWINPAHYWASFGGMDPSMLQQTEEAARMMRDNSSPTRSGISSATPSDSSVVSPTGSPIQQDHKNILDLRVESKTN